VSIYCLLFIALLRFFLKLDLTFKVLNFGAPNFVFNYLCLIDFNSFLIKIFTMILFLIFILFSKNQIKTETIGMLSLERPFLVLSCLFFLFFLISSSDLNLIYLCFEALTFLLAILIALQFNKISIEVAIKYFSLSVVSSGFLILGAVLIYGSIFVTDFFHIKLFFISYKFQISLNYVCMGLFLIILGFFFKLSVYPGHL
jgi:NADH:ubiquinone oxidoreductase subunit 2 (subunit N)